MSRGLPTDLTASHLSVTLSRLGQTCYSDTFMFHHQGTKGQAVGSETGAKGSAVLPVGEGSDPDVVALSLSPGCVSREGESRRP